VDFSPREEGKTKDKTQMTKEKQTFKMQKGGQSIASISLYLVTELRSVTHRAKLRFASLSRGPQDSELLGSIA
jgi:hypothetical protein